MQVRIKPSIRLERKTVAVAFAVLIILAIPASLLHEFGHIIICITDGYSYTLIIQITYAAVTCQGTLSNLILYWALGGTLAAAVVAIPLAFRTVRANEGITIALLTLSTTHSINAVAETFANSWYMSNGIMIMIPSMIIFFVYLFKFGSVFECKQKMRN